MKDEIVESSEEKNRQIKEQLQSLGIMELFLLLDEDLLRLLRQCPDDFARAFIKVVRDERYSHLRHRFMERYLSAILDLPLEEFKVHVTAIAHYHPIYLIKLLEYFSNLSSDEFTGDEGLSLFFRAVHVIAFAPSLLLPRSSLIIGNFLYNYSDARDLDVYIRDVFKINPCIGTVLIHEGLEHDKKQSIDSHERALVRFFINAEFDANETTTLITHLFTHVFQNECYRHFRQQSLVLPSLAIYKRFIRYHLLLMISNPSLTPIFRKHFNEFHQLADNSHPEHESHLMLLQFVLKLADNSIDVRELESLLSVIRVHGEDEENKRNSLDDGFKSKEIIAWKFIYIVTKFLIDQTKQPQETTTVISQKLRQARPMVSIDRLIISMGKFVMETYFKRFMSKIVDAIIFGFSSLESIPDDMVMIFLALNENFHDYLSRSKVGS